MHDLEAIFLSPDDFEEMGEESEEQEPVRMESKYQAVMDPMEEAVAICKLRTRINSTSSSGSQTLRLRALDISSMTTVEQAKIRNSVLLGPHTGVLGRIELSEKVLGRCGFLKRVCRAVGWDLKTVGRRIWVARKLIG